LFGGEDFGVLVKLIACSLCILGAVIAVVVAWPFKKSINLSLRLAVRLLSGEKKKVSGKGKKGNNNTVPEPITTTILQQEQQPLVQGVLLPVRLLAWGIVG
jgi:hypothetical protein